MSPMSSRATVTSATALKALAPSLIDYETAYAHRYMIRYMTEKRRMPPWKASLECGEWHDPAVLTDDEIDLIGRWVDEGHPREILGIFLRLATGTEAGCSGSQTGHCRMKRATR